MSEVQAGRVRVRHPRRSLVSPSCEGTWYPGSIEEGICPSPRGLPVDRPVLPGGILPVNLCADRSRISRLPLPDQFLEGVLCEARTGDPAGHIRDEAIQYALRVTFEARMEMETATDEECTRIIRDRVWPVFEQVCLAPDGYGVAGSASFSGTAKGTALPFTPRGTVARQDETVQSPQQPSSAFTGRALTGESNSLSGDGGIPLPTGSSRCNSAIRRPTAIRGPGSGSGHVPREGASGSRGPLVRDISHYGFHDGCLHPEQGPAGYPGIIPRPGRRSTARYPPGRSE